MEKPISIGMHGENFDALDRKRRVDDVIVMAWEGARILRGSNALWIFTVACVAEEQEVTMIKTTHINLNRM